MIRRNNCNFVTIFNSCVMNLMQLNFYLAENE